MLYSAKISFQIAPEHKPCLFMEIVKKMIHRIFPVFQHAFTSNRSCTHSRMQRGSDYIRYAARVIQEHLNNVELFQWFVLPLATNTHVAVVYDRNEVNNVRGSRVGVCVCRCVCVGGCVRRVCLLVLCYVSVLTMSLIFQLHPDRNRRGQQCVFKLLKWACCK